jgi:transposase-like protein
MRKSRFSEEQIVGMFQEHAAGEATSTLCRRHDISQHTLYRWKQKYDRLGRKRRQAAQSLGGGEREAQAPRR